MQGSRVRFEEVTKAFGATVSLRSYSLDIAPGEFVTLLGRPDRGRRRR